MNWDNVEMIRNAQASAQARFEATALATQEEIQKVINSEAAKSITIPRLTELEQMIFKMRSELIDYIVAHGLVDGLIWDGVLQPIQNGKIVITKEMIEILTEHLGYFTEADVQAFLEVYLPENHYVSDADYVHTDNNYTTDDKNKLAGIETGAEVNKIIDVIFNGVSVLDDGTRVATINITPEDIKRWYESNPDTNAFTDAQKAKLAGISDGAEVNRVDDVLVNGRSVLNENKKALITKEIVKDAYEANADTNAFTDAEKSKLAGIEAGAQVNKVEDVQLDGTTVVNNKKQALLTGAAIKKSYEAQPNTNAFTDAEKSKLDELDKWKPTAETEIANNTAEIAEAKKSISELGDETNSIAGRVTTLEGSAVRDVLLNGATTVDPKTHKATLTAAGIKAAYESNADTNAFTDAEKAKLEGITADAQPNKVEDVQLNGTSVLDAATKVANITAAGIKAAYESNADTNAFTDAEKAKLAELDKWRPTAETEIANNNAEIAEAKKSISALGDEANAIAGRVTTLEDSAVRDVILNGATTVDKKTHKATLTADGIKAAYESNADTNAFTDNEKAKLAISASVSQVTTGDAETLKTANAYADGLVTLKRVESANDADIVVARAIGDIPSTVIKRRRISVNNNHFSTAYDDEFITGSDIPGGTVFQLIKRWGESGPDGQPHVFYTGTPQYTGIGTAALKLAFSNSNEPAFVSIGGGLQFLYSEGSQNSLQFYQFSDTRIWEGQENKFEFYFYKFI